MKPTASQSYAGKTIYVGIDVHKHTYSVVARLEQTEVKRWRMEASPQKLGHQLGKYFPEAQIESGYEAGFSGFGLHRELIRQGIHSQVIHAAAVEVAANQRVKTDQRDAAKIAKQLEAGTLRGIRIPSEAQEQARLLSRTRKQLVEERTQVQNQIRMKAHQFGLIPAGDKRTMSHSFVEALLNQSPGAGFRIAVQAQHAVWKTLDQEIAKLEQQLRQQAEQDPCESIYRSVPGVGPISARVLSNELGTMSQFANERQLFSYTGLTPGEYSSGEQTRRGAITKQGNRQVRAILIGIAWRAIEKEPSLQAFFERITARSGKKRAIVAVARKLIGRIRAALRAGVAYHIPQVSPVSA